MSKLGLANVCMCGIDKCVHHHQNISITEFEVDGFHSICYRNLIHWMSFVFLKGLQGDREIKMKYFIQKASLQRGLWNGTFNLI